MINVSKIKKTIKTKFGFLCSDLGARLVKEEIEPFGIFLTYTTDKAGLRVSFEPREGGVFVMVFPLHDQEIPQYKNWYDVIDLFHAKGVKFVEQNISNYNNPDPKELEEALEHFANNVRIHARSFLEGDFSINEELELIVKKRKSSEKR